MSRLAQAVERAVRELRGRNTQQRRPQMDGEDENAPDFSGVGDGGGEDNNTAAGNNHETEETVAKKRNKGGAKKAKGAKAIPASVKKGISFSGY